MKVKMASTSIQSTARNILLNISIGAGIFVLLYLVLSLITSYGIFG